MSILAGSGSERKECGPEALLKILRRAHTVWITSATATKLEMTEL
jgi:hypothetical protein